MKKIRKIRFLTTYYTAAHKRRHELTNWKWRLLVVLVTAALMTLVYEHLTNKYWQAVSITEGGGKLTETPAGRIAATEEPKTTYFILSEKLFAWFVAGTIFGALMLTILLEGEFVIALAKLARGFEKQLEKGIIAIEREAEREARALAPMVPQPPHPRRKSGKQRKA